MHERAITIEKALKAEKVGHDGFVNCDGSNIFSVRISPSSILRVVLLLDAFLKFLTESGHTIIEQKGGFSILFDGEPFKLSIHETLDKKPHIPTKQELKAEADYAADSRRLPSLYPPGRFKHKKWDHFPSGRLSMDIRDPTIYSWQNENLIGRWNDRGTTKVEDCLGMAVGALRNAAILAKNRRAEKEEKARIEAEKQERQKREEARRLRAKKREDYLLKMAERLSRHKLFSELLDHMKPKVSENTTDKDHKLLKNLQEIITTLECSLSAEKWREDSDRLVLYLDED